MVELTLCVKHRNRPGEDPGLLVLLFDLQGVSAGADASAIENLLNVAQSFQQRVVKILIVRRDSRHLETLIG
jgi:hypothetical protein